MLGVEDVGICGFRNVAEHMCVWEMIECYCSEV
jgi:hypothetical protein